MMELHWRTTRDSKSTYAEQADSGFTAVSTDTGNHYEVLPTITGWRLTINHNDRTNTVSTYRHSDVFVLYKIAESAENNHWSDLYVSQ